MADAGEGASLSLKHGLMIWGVVVFAIVAWIVLGGVALHIQSFYASFLYGWYWLNLEKGDFKRIPASLIGALVGVGLAWALKGLPGLFPQFGLWLALGLVLVALLVQIMNWLPIALNTSAMLFLTVIAAPALLMPLDLIEITKAIIGAALFFTAIAYGAHLYVKATTAG